MIKEEERLKKERDLIEAQKAEQLRIEAEKAE